MVSGSCAFLWPPAQHVEALTCARHIEAAAEVLCVDCVELSCIRCAFECAQNRHKCVRADAILRTAAAQSSVAIDASFERGKQRIRARLDDVAGVGEIGRFIGHSRFPGQS